MILMRVGIGSPFQLLIAAIIISRVRLKEKPRKQAVGKMVSQNFFKDLYCSTQHRERKIVFGYIVLPV